MWPVTWPDQAAADAADPAAKALAEQYAGACMTFLTLARVGGSPVTIMPAPHQRRAGYYAWWEPFPGNLWGNFYPGEVYPSSTDLHTALGVNRTEAIVLPGPVGAVTDVRIDGAVLDPGAYRIEDGNHLVRTDGGLWPAAQGENFTVTYLNSHEVDTMGRYAAGVMAGEWLKLFSKAKGGCRLPSSVTTVSRAGITMEIARGMFPDGLTGIPEIDAYIMLWNPHGLRVAPRVYSPDLPRHRQVWP